MKFSLFLFPLIFLFLFGFLHAQSQQDRPDIYDPGADARKGLNEAVDQARNQGKHVLVMIGGNW